MSDLRNQFKAETGEEFKSKTSYKGGEFIVTGINTKYVIWLEEMLEKTQANGADKSTEPSINYDGLLALEKRSETEVCPLCNNTDEYSFGGSFGGSVQTQRCPCGRT